MPASDDAPAFRFNASVSASSDFYSASGIDRGTPGNVSRLVFRPTFTVSEDLVIPFDLYLTTTAPGYQQPFNQIGVNPRYKDWLTMHGGYFSTHLSDLTFGDVRLLGGGIDLTPGIFRFSAVYGIARLPRNPVPVASFYGDYRRVLFGGRIGVGREEETFVSLNMMHAVDDSTSIDTVGQTPMPTENFVFSISAGTRIASLVHVYTEIGVSAFTSNSHIAPIANVNIPLNLFVLRSSTQADGAAKLGLYITPASNWSLRLNSQWIGPGFTTLGYAQLANDVLEVTAAPDVRLFSNRLMLRGSLGMRLNNLRSNRTATTRRLIGSFYSNATINEHLGFDAQYSNYGMRTDNNSINNIFQYVSIGPRVNFLSGSAAHSIMLNYGYQDVATQTLTRIPLDSTFRIDTASSISQSHMLMATHAMYLRSTWNITTSMFFTYVLSSAVITRIGNLSETVGKQWFNGHFATSATLGYVLVSNTAVDGQIVARMMGSYAIDRYGTVSLNVSNYSYQYGVQTATRSNFNELQASLQYMLNI